VPGRGLASLSFERNEIIDWTRRGFRPRRERSPPFPPTGWSRPIGTGTVRVWDFLEKQVLAFEGGLPLADRPGRRPGRANYAGDQSRRLRRWDLERKTVADISGSGGASLFLRYYPLGKLLAVEGGLGTAVPPACGSSISLPDLRSISAPAGAVVSGVNVYHDGRVIAGTRNSGRGKNLLVFSPRRTRLPRARPERP